MKKKLQFSTFLKIVLVLELLLSTYLLLQPSEVQAELQPGILKSTNTSVVKDNQNTNAPVTYTAENTAPQPIGLTVTPTTAYLKVAPGNSAIHAISLTNDGKEMIKVAPKIVSFSADGTSGQPVLLETLDFPYLDEDKTSLQPLLLQAEQTAQLTLHISVPNNAERAEFPMTVLFETVPAEENELTSPATKLSGTIGSNLVVLITSEKEPKAQLTVADWQTWTIIDSLSKIEVQPVVQNDAYAAGVASGSATITNWQGKSVAQFQIQPAIILGNSSRTITPIEQLAFSYDSPFLIGPYEIEVTLVQSLETGATARVDQTTVIALPISLLLTIVLSVGLWWLYKTIRQSRVPF